MVDGLYRLSAVVTNGFSDWSTQVYPTADLGIRIYRFGASFVVSTIDYKVLYSFDYVEFSASIVRL